MFTRSTFATSRNRLVTKHDEETRQATNTADKTNQHGVKNFASTVKRLSVPTWFSERRGVVEGKAEGGVDAMSGLVFTDLLPDHPDAKESGRAPVAILPAEGAYDLGIRDTGSGGRIQRLGYVVIFYGTLTGTANIVLPKGYKPVVPSVAIGGAAAGTATGNVDGTTTITHSAGAATPTIWLTRDFIEGQAAWDALPDEV